jgi:CBS domain-containing protein
MKVQEIMTRDVVTIGPEADLRDVARILVESGISGLPVCGARRELLGVISEGDIVLKEGGLVQGRRFRRVGEEREKKVEATTVREAMTSPVVTISPHAPVAEAARTMAELGIKRLPVVRNGALVGIVSRTDLVRAFVRSDADIRHEIREDILVRTLWLEAPAAVGVEVERGVVRLTGRLESEFDAELVPRLVARIPGVVSVKSELTARPEHGVPVG